MSKMFCISRLPMGRRISVSIVLPIHDTAVLMIKGMVNSVMILLSAVKRMDSATFPFANIENTFEELPPGQQAMRMTPM